MLSKENAADLERLQSQSLKIIYGFHNSYNKLLEITGLEKLEVRRDAAIRRFATKCLNGNYSHWFPLNPGRARTRARKKYQEEYARCDRMRNTPIYHMRRVLNDMEAEEAHIQEF
jgi:hypothetical protein